MAYCRRVSHRFMRFGTPSRAVDVTAAATILVIIASGGRVAWLARAYAVGIAAMLVFTIAALVRLRRVRQGTQPFGAPETCASEAASFHWGC
jgi:hypothetical protein